VWMGLGFADLRNCTPQCAQVFCAFLHEMHESCFNEAF
jgi:hypothetical protein